MEMPAVCGGEGDTGSAHRKEEKLVAFCPPRLEGSDGGDWRSDRPFPQEKSFEPAAQQTARLQVVLGGRLGSAVLRVGAPGRWLTQRTELLLHPPHGHGLEAPAGVRRGCCRRGKCPRAGVSFVLHLIALKRKGIEVEEKFFQDKRKYVKS